MTLQVPQSRVPMTLVVLLRMIYFCFCTTPSFLVFDRCDHSSGLVAFVIDALSSELSSLSLYSSLAYSLFWLIFAVVGELL